jgi:type I restriction enzyme, S subunit
LSEMFIVKMLDKQKNKCELMPYLGNINVRWGAFDLDDLKQMRFEAEEVERYGLKIGDLIICEGGEPGRCAIWNFKDKSVMIQKALHRVRVNEDVNVKYIYYLIQFKSFSGSLEEHFTGTTIKHLTGRELRKIKVPFTSLEEQNIIVQEIESRFSVADKMEESITQSLRQAEALRQSILKKAFEGKLI